MQIDQIKIADFIKGATESDGLKTNVQGSDKDFKEVQTNLRDINIQQNNYNKQGLTSGNGEAMLESMEKNSNLDATTRERMELFTDETNADVFGQIEDEGFDPADTDANTLVTIADEIKANLAKAGVDISKMGGLSDAELDAMGINASQAKQMVSELPQTLTEDSVKYLVNNGLEPTIKNIYQATFSTTTGGNGQELSKQELASMTPQIEKVIEEAGHEVTEDTVATAGEMLAAGVGLTEQSFKAYEMYKNFELPAVEDINNAIVDATIEGKEPEDAYLVEGLSTLDKAQAVYDKVMEAAPSDLESISKQRELLEVQLTMTIEVNYTLIKNGTPLDTMGLTQIVDTLKAQEEALIKLLFGGKSKLSDITDDMIDAFKETTEAVNDVKEMPLSAVGSFSYKSIQTLSFKEVRDTAVISKDTYEKANESYEALMTSPRKDMGDSIQKAFRNVDDILEDIGLEISEPNQRAVRALAYNEISITKENVLETKAVNEQVIRTMKNMTGPVVAEMIKNGKNPLDMSMEDLLKETEKISSDLGAKSDDANFAKFLWQAEHAGDITEAQRESFIGVYRLLYQIEKTDGAAIGAVMQQGADVTLRNLFTAVKSAKKEGREYKIDDNFGGLEQLNVKDLSILQQIEVAYQTDCAKDALEYMSVEKMAQYPNEDAYMNLSPEQFSLDMQSFEDFDEDYNVYTKEQLQEAFQSEEKIYALLEKFDIPTTANTLFAMQQFLRDKNKFYRDLFEKAEGEDEEIDLNAVIGKLMEDFGEACKTPEEMAKAEKKLAEVAENAMKKVMVEEDVRSIDIRGMKLIKTQIHSLGQIAEKEETYHMPIMVADEMGNLTLKIVSGEDKKGLVDIAFDMESTGRVSASFRYEAGSITGKVDCDNASTMEKMLAKESEITNQISREIGMDVSFSYNFTEELDTDEIYDDFDAEKAGFVAIDKVDRDEITTRNLYTIARSFIQNISTMLG